MIVGKLGYNRRLSYDSANFVTDLILSVLNQQRTVPVMPIYEYQCKECGHNLEVIQRFSDAPLTECPACKCIGLSKLVSAPSFRLKGGGWYETDFKTANKRHGTQDADGGASKKSDADSGSSTGPAKKPDTVSSTAPAATGS
jgi:putative FmdB family regulatory protein